MLCPSLKHSKWCMMSSLYITKEKLDKMLCLVENFDSKDMKVKLFMRVRKIATISFVISVCLSVCLSVRPSVFFAWNN